MIEKSINSRFLGVLLLCTAITICVVFLQTGRQSATRASGSTSLSSSSSTPSGLSAKSSKSISYWKLSPNGKVMALDVYETLDNANDTNSYVVLVDVNQKNGVLLSVLDHAAEPAWSPDSSLLAYSKKTKRAISYPEASGIAKDILDESKPTESRIVVYSLDSDMHKSLTDGSEDIFPLWNDAKTLLAFKRVYVSKDKIGRQLEVIETSSAGFSKPMLVLKRESGISNEMWRPGCNEILYMGWTISYKKGKSIVHRDLYLVDAITRKNQRLTDSGNIGRFGCAWSPDGRYVAFTTVKASNDQFQTLEVLDVDTRSRKTIVKAEDINATHGSVESISWSPEGEMLVIGVLSAKNRGESNIASVQLDSGKFTWLTQDGKSGLPLWRPDGKSILYVRNKAEIWEMGPDGKQIRKIYQLD